VQQQLVEIKVHQNEHLEVDENLSVELEGGNVANQNQAEEYKIQTRSATRANVPREVKNLYTFYNPILFTAEEQTELMLLYIKS
jgi:hypothetical protein